MLWQKMRQDFLSNLIHEIAVFWDIYSWLFLDNIYEDDVKFLKTQSC